MRALCNRIQHVNDAWLRLFVHSPVIHKPTKTKVHILGVNLLNVASHARSVQNSIQKLDPAFIGWDQLSGNEGWIKEYHSFILSQLHQQSSRTSSQSSSSPLLKQQENQQIQPEQQQQDIDDDLQSVRLAHAEWARSHVEYLLDAGAPEAWVLASVRTGLLAGLEEAAAISTTSSSSVDGGEQRQGQGAQQNKSFDVKFWRDSDLAEAEVVAGQVARMRAEQQQEQLMQQSKEESGQLLEGKLLNDSQTASLQQQQQQKATSTKTASEAAGSLESTLATLFAQDGADVSLLKSLIIDPPYPSSLEQVATKELGLVEVALQDLLVTPELMLAYRSAVKNYLISSENETLRQRLGLFEELQNARLSVLVGKIHVACFEMIADKAASFVKGLGGAKLDNTIVVVSERKLAAQLHQTFEDEIEKFKK